MIYYIDEIVGDFKDHIFQFENLLAFCQDGTG